MTKKFLNWRDVEEGVERLALNIEKSGLEFSGVYGLPRGGLIPAVMLSHRLSIPFLGEDTDDSGNILIVDDICDSGETLDVYREFENIQTVTLHYKTTAIYEPNFWWKIASQGDWIVYPWERRDSEAIQDYKKPNNAT